ncbi:cysteine desulfurase family protein [Waltera sp.]|uniref:cysteine desulfurase family protein n=1 Tax=Waltera sp. TaxID=2815806 RepID=UPI003AB79F7C
MKQYVYADNAATTKLDKVAFDAMSPFLMDEYGNASQPYAFARSPKKALQEARETIASCIGASPDEIFFTSGGTESDNWAIKGIVMSDEGNHTIITSSFEHHAVLHSCAALERKGHRVIYLRPDDNGVISANELREKITEDTKLVSIMFANNEIGSIQPIEDLCKIAHSKGALFHTDAVQAVGHVKIDVKSLGIDMMSASAHKFNGMKGCGFLYVHKGCQLPSYADGGSQESGHRAGTENIPGIVAMATALKNNCSQLDENKDRIARLEQELLRQLKETHIPFLRNGGESILPGLVSLSFPGADGEAILHRMDLMGICISTGSACNSQDTEISHVLKAIELNEDYAKGTIRISLGKYNTMEDVDKIVRGLEKILK